MNCNSLNICQTGPGWGSVWLAGLVLVVFSSVALAQEGRSLVVNDSLAGVRIGSSLDEARATLTLIGTGGGRETRDGGRKEAWTFKDGDYTNLAFKTDGKGKVSWVSAFVRPGKERPFARFGDISKASVTESEAIWNVASPQGGYRLVVKGSRGKASVVYMLSLAVPEVK